MNGLALTFSHADLVCRGYVTRVRVVTYFLAIFRMFFLLRYTPLACLFRPIWRNIFVRSNVLGISSNERPSPYPTAYKYKIMFIWHEIIRRFLTPEIPRGRVEYFIFTIFRNTWTAFDRIYPRFRSDRNIIIYNYSYSIKIIFISEKCIFFVFERGFF